MHALLLRCLAAALSCVVAITACSPARAEPPLAKPDVDRLVQPLVDDGWLFGVAVGVISARGQEVLGYGRVAAGDSRTPDGDTVFELASVTKVFTGLLLAQMVEAGTVRLDTPVQELLPDGVRVPQFEDREITLADLATHSSGLPRLPGNIKPLDMKNPYADYTVEQLYEFLGTAKLSRAPGKESDYSNLGVGLLGHALASKLGKSYEEAVISEICQPLRMESTRITLDDDLRRRLAEPHDADGGQEKNWDVPTLAGAGGLRSTVSDMLKFLAANLDLVDVPFASAIKLAQQPHFDLPGDTTAVGLGWQLSNRQGMVWHNGQTGGYHTFVGMLPARQVGVVVLANTATMRAVDELGTRILALLAGDEAEPLKLPAVAKVPANLLEELSGAYSLGDNIRLTLIAKEGMLVARMPGQPPLKLLPESAERFFCRAVPGTFTFERDEDKSISGIAIELLGEEMRAKRLD